MVRKNPENKPLRIVRDPSRHLTSSYANMLGQLAIAQSNLVKAGKDSALPHFIAIVKELEKEFGFKFEQIDDTQQA